MAAQPAAKQVPLIVDFPLDPAKKNVEGGSELELRPNTAAELGVELRNKAGEILGNVALKVVQIVNGQEIVLAEARVARLMEVTGKQKGLVVQEFEKIKGGPDKLELVGLPPFKLQLHVQAKNLPLLKRELRLVIREPRDYLTASARVDRVKKELHFLVEPAQENEFIGSRRMPVILVLGDDVKAPKGIFKQELDVGNQKLSLLAEDWAFDRKLTEGEVYLNVDGYERAFIYPLTANFNGFVGPRPSLPIRVRIHVPRYASPNPKFEVPLEIDGPLSGNYKVHLGLDPIGNNNPLPASAVREFDGLRQQKVILSITKEGKLTCETQVRDWRGTFDTSTILGRDVWLRVSVFKDGNKVNLTTAPETRPLRSRTVTLDPASDIKNVFAQVTQDDSPPTGLSLEVANGKEPTVGVPFEVYARAAKRAETQAPIVSVVFFKSKPKDNKLEIPAADVLETIQSDNPKDWKLKHEAPKDPGSITLSALFVTATGARAVATETFIVVKPPDDVVQKSGKFTIKGQVVRGPLGRPGLEVKLLDAKEKKELTTVKSGEGGAFVFENVAAGSYFASARVGGEKLFGMSGPFGVPGDGKKETQVTIKLEPK